MRWKVNRPNQVGDLKVSLNFALFPVRCEGDTMAWLEFYEAVYEWVYDEHMLMVPKYWGWRHLRNRLID